MIKRALISVSKKDGLEIFAPFLNSLGVEIISTGGTWKYLQGLNVNPIEVRDFTGFPEIMDGRVKTLHPKIHGGILNIRGKKEHQEAMFAHGILPIDMVVVNLYPFKEVVAKGCTFEEAIENIDIGGPSMIRGAAKNHKDVSVVVDPADYIRIINMMKALGGDLTEEMRYYLAKKVFKLTFEYDQAIYEYLDKMQAAWGGEE